MRMGRDAGREVGGELGRGRKEEVRFTIYHTSLITEGSGDHSNSVCIRESRLRWRWGRKDMNSSSSSSSSSGSSRRSFIVNYLHGTWKAVLATENVDTFRYTNSIIDISEDDEVSENVST